jgi:hypothetical protein
LIVVDTAKYSRKSWKLNNLTPGGMIPSAKFEGDDSSKIDDTIDDASN